MDNFTLSAPPFLTKGSYNYHRFQPKEPTCAWVVQSRTRYIIRILMWYTRLMKNANKRIFANPTARKKTPSDAVMENKSQVVQRAFVPRRPWMGAAPLSRLITTIRTRLPDSWVRLCESRVSVLAESWFHFVITCVVDPWNLPIQVLYLVERQQELHTGSTGHWKWECPALGNWWPVELAKIRTCSFLTTAWCGSSKLSILCWHRYRPFKMRTFPPHASATHDLDHALHHVMEELGPPWSTITSQMTASHEI